MNKFICLFLLFVPALLFPARLAAFQQQEPDTLKAELQTITVVGYEGNRSILETPGAITKVDAELLGGFEQGTLLYGLNSVAGVRFEQRAPGSYRVAIRGSALRSPFGVRNVKIYWNGIPFTEPTGSTPLNLLDQYNMQEVEVIKGPAGSMYGAGNGGVLRIQSNRPVLSDHAEAHLSAGSYDRIRYTLGYRDAFDGGSLSLKLSDESSEGYRAQSFMDRKVLEVSGNAELSENRDLQASFLHSKLNYGIPGGLTKEQFNNNPRQARPGNDFVLGSEEANASILQETVLLSLKHDYRVTEKVSISSAAYGTMSDFENPFNFDYKRDSRKSAGIRSVYAYDTSLGNTNLKIQAGNEIGFSKYVARNFENDSGETGDLNFDDELEVKEVIVFTSAEADLPGGWILNGGLSYNYLKYDINRLVTNLEDDETRRVIKTFDPQIIPRLALIKRLQPNLSVHASVSLGFSPPTIEEVRTNEGSINTNLEPERGTNYEAGVRGYTKNARLSYDITAFYYRLDETIVQQQSERGTVLFNNAGNTDQFGVEASGEWLVLDRPGELLSGITWRASYTWHHFRFNEYRKDGSDYSGNELTGVAPHTLVSSLNLKSSAGLYMLHSYTWSDEIPLNDGNTVYSDPYHLLQSKVGYRMEISGNWQAEVYAGIDNLLDEQYSLGYDLNAFGNRYYQPAAARNWFAGVKLRVDLD